MQRLRDELLATVAIAIVLAVILRSATLASAGGGGFETFRTHPNLLLVDVTVYPDRPPTIGDVDIVPEGRITVTAPGDSHIRIEDGRGRILHEQAFQPDFTTTAHELISLPEAQLTFVLPNPSAARRVVVVTPQGETSREIRR